MFVTTIDNVKDFNIVESVMDGILYTSHNVNVYPDANSLAITGKGAFKSFAQSVNGQHIVDNTTLVYAYTGSVKDHTKAWDAIRWPLHWRKRYMMGFSGQFMRVSYVGSDGIMRQRTIKTVGKFKQSRKNNLLKVYDASVKGYRSIRLDRVLSVSFKGIKESFNI